MELSLWEILHFSLTSSASLGQLSFTQYVCKVYFWRVEKNETCKNWLWEATAGGIGRHSRPPPCMTPIGFAVSSALQWLTAPAPQPSWLQSPPYSPCNSCASITTQGNPTVFHGESRSAPAARTDHQGAGHGGRLHRYGFSRPGAPRCCYHICFMSVWEIVFWAIWNIKFGKMLLKLRAFLLHN